MAKQAAHVLVIRTLGDLRSALVRFSGSARDAMRAAEAEIRRTQEWLRERENHWQREVERCQVQVERARRAYESCMRHSRSRDKNERGSDCSAEAAALRQAEQALREAQAKLALVRQWQARLREAVARYQVHARRLQELSTSRTEQARTFLANKQADLERYRAQGFRALQSQLAGASPAQRGALFEAWANDQVFGGKRRLAVPPELNQHLCDADDEGLGLLQERFSDAYVDQDGSLWDAKAYGENSAIPEDQLRDYSLMERVGFVYDSEGQKVEITSVNYLFSDRAAAEANAPRLRGLATAWYIDDRGAVHLLEGQ